MPYLYLQDLVRIYQAVKRLPGLVALMEKHADCPHTALWTEQYTSPLKVSVLADCSSSQLNRAVENYFASFQIQNFDSFYFLFRANPFCFALRQLFLLILSVYILFCCCCFSDCSRSLRTLFSWFSTRLTSIRWPITNSSFAHRLTTTSKVCTCLFFFFFYFYFLFLLFT